MTDRGLPIVDGAPACPFVAFEDDRDGRGTAPDHRHRCYAEPRPAARALAHQEAYCLSSAFPVCPTFQDWARREAAAARPADDPGMPPPELPASRPMPPRDLEPHHAPETDDPLPEQPRRNPPRDWAAPPPWSAQDDLDEPYQAAAGPSTPQLDQGSAAGAAGWGGPAQGLAGSAAYRLAGPDPDEPLPARPTERDPDPVGGGRSGLDVPGEPNAYDRYEQPDRHQGSVERYGPPDRRGSPARSAPRPGPSQARPAPAPARRGDPDDPSELFGPAWEHPRRYEAYPTLRTRVGLPSFGGVSRLGLAAAAVVLAAVALFFVGPMLLGIGSSDNGPGTPTTAPSADASVTPVPTEPPAPTPQTYVVAKGDTISKIAKKFGLTQEELLAANPQIKNPDKIGIGDEITIPLPNPSGVPDASGVPEASGEVSSAP